MQYIYSSSFTMGSVMIHWLSIQPRWWPSVHWTEGRKRVPFHVDIPKHGLRVPAALNYRDSLMDTNGRSSRNRKSAFKTKI